MGGLIRSKQTITMLIAGFVAACLPSVGQAAPTGSTTQTHYYVPEVPADMSKVDFYLLTVGLGEDLASRFGHTGLRILDRDSGMDVVFNWGKFSFNDPAFAWKFFRGSLVYSMGVRTFKAEVEIQREDGRRIVQQAINLTTTQKRRLMEKVAWNAVPEHRDFPYQYWFKNCATMPRDAIDEAVAGQVHARYQDKLTDQRFRDYVRSNLAAIPFVVPLLDVMMNSNLDRPITAWEEMFLPEKLREHLSSMPSIDDSGNPVPGTALLGTPEVLLDLPEPGEPPFNDYLAAVLPIMGPLLLAGGWLGLSRRKTQKVPSRAAYRLLGWAVTAWSLAFGGLGLTLLLNWAFSGHPDGWHSPNLLIFWPVDLLMLPLGWRLLRSGTPVKDRWPFPGAARFFAIGHAATLILLIALVASGVIVQDVWRAVAWGGVTTVALLGGLLALGFNEMPVVAKTVEQQARGKGRRHIGDARRNPN